MNKRAIFAIIILVSLTVQTVANNIQVSGVSLGGQDTVLDFTMVQFDISWENSWRTSTLESNWDAAWVFVKYRKTTSSEWKHATLNYVDGTAANDGHTEPAGATITTPSDGVGAFVYRSVDGGQGTVNFTCVRLRWNYGVDSISDNDSVEVSVFAIEMVYVPQSGFFVGDGTTTNTEGHFEDSTSGNPFIIGSENAITLGGGAAGSLGNNNATPMSPSDDFDDVTSQTLPASFPKGYAGFYCMKYYVTQGEYADFLNKLTFTQDANRFANANGTGRHTIGGTPGNRVAGAPYRACNYIDWNDGAAYLDWAGLRPMTELEYEKACRGTAIPVPGEFAWGSTNLIGATSILNDSTATETAGNAGANCIYGYNLPEQGPMRVGWPAGGNRENAGATYYGIMGMTGNIYEIFVTVGNPQGRAFDGQHGDGKLDVDGYADVPNWPDFTSTGVGYKGGAFDDAPSDLNVSERTWVNYGAYGRSIWHGTTRGVRTMP